MENFRKSKRGLVHYMHEVQNNVDVGFHSLNMNLKFMKSSAMLKS
jgi:hypothetical protein